MTHKSAAALAVDLDGTLVLTDTLSESVLEMIRKNPWSAARIPLWLLRGKTAFKSEVGRHVQLGVEHLPWRMDLVDYLRAEKLAGRFIVLATAANASTAEAVAVYLGVFDEVFASSCQVNLKGVPKRDALVRRFGVGGFDYVGDSADDIPVWTASRIAHLAGRRRRLPDAVFSGNAMPGRSFGSPPASVKDWLQAIGVRWWLITVLVFAPAVPSLRQRLIPFIAFPFIGSGIYLIYQLLRLEKDRRDTRRRNRPLARGVISIGAGVGAALLLLAGGIGLLVAGYHKRQPAISGW